MEASADSQDAFLHDDFTLSTVRISIHSGSELIDEETPTMDGWSCCCMQVEEGSEESQSCTFAPDAELLSADNGGGGEDDEAAERSRYDDDAYEGEGGEDENDYTDTRVREGFDDCREGSAEEQPSAEEDACYAQEHEEDHEDGDTEDAERASRSEDERQQFASDFVGSCHVTLTRLRKRKREQEERVEALVESVCMHCLEQMRCVGDGVTPWPAFARALMACCSCVPVAFGQIDAVVNSLMGAIQECHAGSHNRFEIADEKLVRNLQFHDRVRAQLARETSVAMCSHAWI